jgi:hypothetical protein
LSDFPGALTFGGLTAFTSVSVCGDNSPLVVALTPAPEVPAAATQLLQWVTTRQLLI